MLPCTTKCRLDRLGVLVRGSKIGAVRREVRVEGTTLAYIVIEGFASVQDRAILLSILGTGLILCTLIRLNFIAKLVQICERLSNLSTKEALSLFRKWTRIRSIVHVLKFRLPNKFL